MANQNATNLPIVPEAPRVRNPWMADSDLDGTSSGDSLCNLHSCEDLSADGSFKVVLILEQEEEEEELERLNLVYLDRLVNQTSRITYLVPSY